MPQKNSNIITIGNGLYEYELPSLPKETDIWYHDLPKKDQYWKTPANKNSKWLNPDNTIKNVYRMNERDRIEYVNYWRDKWENGLWVMINGEPTYLNGLHIDHLVFNQFNGKFFYYLDAQRERFYFREITNKDRLCDGRTWVKCRRAGITSEQITENIRCIISDYSNFAACQSDTHEKAKSTLLSKIIDTYIRRPKWMREDFYSSNGKVPRASLELTTSVLTEDDDYPMGGSVRAFASTPKSLDGLEFMLVTMDELSKWEGISPYETFEINKKTIVNPGKRGKMDCLSTTGDSKDAAKAVVDWHKLVADSNPNIRNANGKTNSGCYKFFIGAIHSQELIELLPDVMDKYGKVNKEMAEEYIWNEINRHPKNSKEYIYACYKMPIEERHALLTITSNTYFSKMRIQARLDYLRGLPNDRKPYVRGRLEESSTGKVYFEADEYGHWLVALHPYWSTEKGIDTRNRFTKSSAGVFFPPINPEFGGGYDPIRYKKQDTTSTSLSKACIIMSKKFDYYGSGESNQYAAIYLDRPDDPEDAHKEAIKACKYWGAPMMHERVIESVKRVFEENNMLPFLQKNQKDEVHGMWIDSQGKVVQNAVDSLAKRFSAPREENEVDQIATMPFEECLTDMDGFDLANTTKFDVFMAMIENDYSLKQILFTNLVDVSSSRIAELMNELYPTRN